MGMYFTVNDTDLEITSRDQVSELLKTLPEEVLEYFGVVSVPENPVEALAEFKIKSINEMNNSLFIYNITETKWTEHYRTIFETLAPIINPNSFIEFLGDYSERHWKYAFNSPQPFAEYTPKITWVPTYTSPNDKGI